MAIRIAIYAKIIELRISGQLSGGGNIDCGRELRIRPGQLAITE